MLEFILKNAIEQNQKGINILLYGVPGSGKTEMAKTLARCLKASLYEVTAEDLEKEECSRNDRLQDLSRKLRICENLKEKQLKKLKKKEKNIQKKSKRIKEIKINIKIKLLKMLKDNNQEKDIK